MMMLPIELLNFFIKFMYRLLAETLEYFKF